MGMTGEGMRDAVFDALFIAGSFGEMSESELSDVKDSMLIAEQARVEYIIENMEISGIEISDPSETVEVYTAGSGSNGGALTGQVPIVGSVVQAGKTRSQSNDGTGRVS
jgi:hypothetical protein